MDNKEEEMYGLKMPHRRDRITLCFLRVLVESHSVTWLMDESHCEVCLSISPLKLSSSRHKQAYIFVLLLIRHYTLKGFFQLMLLMPGINFELF